MPLTPLLRTLTLALLLGVLLPALAEDEWLITPLPLADARDVGPIRIVAGFQLRSTSGDFGGCSSLLLEEAATQAVCITDRGYWFRLGLTHGEKRLTEVKPLASGPLHTSSDKRRLPLDVESAVRWNGHLILGIERIQELWEYDDLTAIPTVLAAPAELSRMRKNSGIEAMAVTPAGELLIIAEEGDKEGIHGAWRRRADGWEALTYRTTEEFSPVDAALLPDGDLLVLERRYITLRGFTCRLMRIDREELASSRELRPQEIYRIHPPLPLDNFEAMATRRAGDSVDIYLLSDDNFSPLQGTYLLQLRYEGRQVAKAERGSGNQ